MKKFMGLENELSAWTYEDIYKFESFKNHFNKFIKPSDFKKGKLAVRSPEGLAFYVDGEELEINTPPVVVNKGFATRLTDALMIGQNRILQFGDKHGLEFTGYSIHWNISRNKKSLLADDFYQGVAVPFRLFGTTPISTGIYFILIADMLWGFANMTMGILNVPILGDIVGYFFIYPFELLLFIIPCSEPQQCLGIGLFVTSIIGFLFGWGIHSLVRRLRNGK